MKFSFTIVFLVSLLVLAANCSQAGPPRYIQIEKAMDEALKRNGVECVGTFTVVGISDFGPGYWADVEFKDFAIKVSGAKIYPANGMQRKVARISKHSDGKYVLEYIGSDKIPNFVFGNLGIEIK